MRTARCAILATAIVLAVAAAGSAAEDSASGVAGDDTVLSLAVYICDPIPPEGPVPGGRTYPGPGAGDCTAWIGLSPDGRRLALETRHRLEMIDIESGETMWVRRLEGLLQRSAFSPDGRIIAASTQHDGPSEFLDVETGETTAETRCEWRRRGDRLLDEADGLVLCHVAVIMLSVAGWPFEGAVSLETGEVVPVPGPSGSGGIAYSQLGGVAGPVAISPTGEAALWGADPILDGDEHRLQYFNQSGLAWERDNRNGRVLEITGNGAYVVFYDPSNPDSIGLSVVDAASGEEVERIEDRYCERNLILGLPWRGENELICVGSRSAGDCGFDSEECLLFAAPSAGSPVSLPFDPGWMVYANGAFLRGGGYFAYVQQQRWRADLHQPDEPMGRSLRIVRMVDGELVYERALTAALVRDRAQVSIAADGSRAASVLYAEGATESVIEVWDLPSF